MTRTVPRAPQHARMLRRLLRAWAGAGAALMLVTLGWRVHTIRSRPAKHARIMPVYMHTQAVQLPETLPTHMHMSSVRSFIHNNTHFISTKHSPVNMLTTFPVNATPVIPRHVLLRNFSTVQRHNTADYTAMFSMLTPDILNITVNTGKERRINVQKSLNVWPKLQTFKASYQLDESCISVLRQMKISISDKYYSDEKGVGWIHAGKVGLWCSFLRYLSYCKQSRAVVCVCIEDDFLLSPVNIAKIEAEAMHIATSPAKHSIVNLGLHNEVNVIDARKLDSALRYFWNFKISQPLDHTIWKSKLGVAKRVFNKEDRIFVGKTSSTLVCPTCQIHTVSSVNALIRQDESATANFV